MAHATGRPPVLSDRTWNLNQLLFMMQPGSELRITPDFTVKRTPAYYAVTSAEFGSRRVKESLLVVLLADGRWPCTICGQGKSPEDFGDNAYGKRTECKACVAKRTRAWYERSKDTERYRQTARRAQARYRARHLERMREKDRLRRRVRAWKRYGGTEIGRAA